ncbi:hypothetical protein CP061683_0697A, partial [Chlamydia psittaci 06-1683]
MKMLIIPRDNATPPTALSNKNQRFKVSVIATQLPTVATIARVIRATEIIRETV